MKNNIDLSIIVPTLNERDNVGLLKDAISKVLSQISWEIIFVDDSSTDGTIDSLKDLSLSDPRVKYVVRKTERGLSSACIKGIGLSNATVCAVMDADLQHDEGILFDMYEAINRLGLDLVIGSRYVQGGSLGEMSFYRRFVSKLATILSHALLRIDVKDPMSGYFMFKKEFFNHCKPRISGKGFKILLDLIVSSKKKVNFLEMPYEFKLRNSGKSKLNYSVVFEYITLLISKMKKSSK